MKKIILSLIAISAITLAACNNSGNKHEAQSMDSMNNMKMGSAHAGAMMDTAVKTVAVSYTNVDAKAAASIKEIVDHYLQIKNALATDNGGDAATAGKAMDGAIGKLDKSLLTADQKKAFDNIEDGLKEDAEHIGKNGDNIKHQREHFAMMSGAMYNLVKAFGGGRALYHDHCPMYNEDKGGAMWISEIKEVKNPYLGKEMPDCGSVEEVIK